MAPKRERSVSSNNNSPISNENQQATTSATNSTSTTIQSTTTTTSTTPANTNNSTTTSGVTILPVLLADAAAEQRNIAYQANAKLCRLVRKCPWMYDRNHHNYGKKHILDKSWCKIAKECSDSVASCKERWRNIRAAFARSINIYKTHSGPNRVKPYYLYKELSFLVKPMLEGRDKKDEYDEVQEIGSGVFKDEELAENEGGDEDEEEGEEPPEDEDFIDDTADIRSAFEALNPDIRIQAETRYQSLLRNNHNNNINSNNNYNTNNNSNNNNCSNDFNSNKIFEPQTEFNTNSDAETEFRFSEDTLPPEAERRGTPTMNQNGVKRSMHLENEAFDNKRFKLAQSANASNENDVRFLEALLPDMALMNTRQKVVFKRKIYQTLEEVFENSNDFPNVEQNKPEIKAIPSANANNMSCSQQFSHNYNPLSTQTQIRQTVLTVNSSTARNLINNIANLNESELQKVNGFLQNSLRNNLSNGRTNNNLNNTPSSAAAKLMSSTPKITITKVACPPPAALRNLALTKPPSPSPATVSTTIHNPSSAVISSNVHSTTSSNMQQNTSPWAQLLPITIKDEIDDVDIV